MAQRFLGQHVRSTLGMTRRMAVAAVDRRIYGHGSCGHLRRDSRAPLTGVTDARTDVTAPQRSARYCAPRRVA
jgi:hypothetical protein